jgi:hypothetical protein
VRKRGKRGADSSLKPAGAQGEKERERGGGGLGAKATRRKEGGGSTRARGGSASWIGTARMWWIQVAPTAAGSARFTGVTGAGC